MRNRRWLRLLPVLPVLVGTGVLVGFVWCLVAGNLAIGRVTNVRPTTTQDGSRVVVTRAELAPLPTRIIVIPSSLFPTTGERIEDLHGQWIITSGSCVAVHNRRVLLASQLTFVHTWPHRLQRTTCALSSRISQSPTVAIVLSVLTLCLGYLGLRLVAALMVGVLGAAFASLVGALLQAHDVVPDHVAVTYAFASLGFLAGGAAGFRRGGVLGFLAQRLIVLCGVLVFAESMAGVLHVPRMIVLVVGIVGSLLSPAIGLWLLCGWMLCLGLGTHGAAGYVVMAIAGLAVHVLTGGRWLSVAWRWRRRRWKGETPLADLMNV